MSLKVFKEAAWSYCVFKRMIWLCSVEDGLEGAKLEAGRAVRRHVMIKVKDTGAEPPRLWW